MKSEKTLADHLVRLEKHIAQIGLCSRREGKTLIVAGKISVNGKIIRETGFGIDPNHDQVVLVGGREQKQTVAIHKPRGIETTKTSPEHQDIHDIFPQYKNLAPIGRLDKDSEGLILLSNDGLIARAITGAKSDVEKEYVVTTREIVTDEAITKMSKGIILDGKKTLPAVVKKITAHIFSIILHEGRKHQIRRMADACRLTIEQLVRVRVGGVKLGDLKSGESRVLTEKELVNLQ